MRVQGDPVVIIFSRSSIRFGWLFFYRLKIRNVQNISCSTINLGPGLQSINGKRRTYARKQFGPLAQKLS